MGFSINTNISAMNAHQVGVQNNRLLDSSLEKLSTGLKINKSADDASGMAIADSLRSQANTLGQAIRNGNDGIGIVQIADKGMDEQVKILDTIKTKATQAAQDGQTEESRKMLQGDITKLMQELDNIASTTIYNGQSLLDGSFTNKQFQIGSYSNQAINVSIGATGSNKIGTTRFETGATITAAHISSMKFLAVDGSKDITLESAVISTSAGTGISSIAEIINKNSNAIGVKASWKVITTGKSNIKSGTILGLSINGVNLGNINDVQENDRDGKLVAAINRLTDKHGIEAYVDERGNLNLKSIDGRGIKVTTNGATDGSTKGVSGLLGLSGIGVNGENSENYGRLTLTRLDGRDITISGNAKGVAGVAATGFDGNKEAQTTLNLRNMLSAFTVDQASAMGAFANYNSSAYSAANQVLSNGKKAGMGSGVTTLEGAMVMMDVSETAMKMLDAVRANLGATQNQIVATVNNISVTQVNVKAAESQIRDVDFAAESANFQKNNILAQSGSYALSQANAVQLNIMKLLT